MEDQAKRLRELMGGEEKVDDEVLIKKEGQNLSCCKWKRWSW